jgi:hypothetical protein
MDEIDKSIAAVVEAELSALYCFKEDSVDQAPDVVAATAAERVAQILARFEFWKPKRATGTDLKDVHLMDEISIHYYFFQLLRQGLGRVLAR